MLFLAGETCENALSQSTAAVHFSVHPAAHLSEWLSILSIGRIRPAHHPRRQLADAETYIPANDMTGEYGIFIENISDTLG